VPLPYYIEQGYLLLADAIFDRVTGPVPSHEQLKQCKIISHRGVHDNHLIAENTIAAFEQAENAGVWGIELDVRWTRDFEPVVFHDPDLKRLYGVDKNISAYSFSGLRKRFPTIPTLSEVVHRFGRKRHLMIDVKMQPWLDSSKQVPRLYRILAPLEPSKDYHLITFHPEILAPMREIPMDARVAIASHWPALPSKWVRRHRWGGLCGHYLMVGKKIVKSHHQHGQKVGTAYIQSRNTLFRELNRGIDWIFSNSALRVQRILDEAIDRKRAC
jgi:glycerophosphoryl diester phosphodiesterase